MHPIGDHNQVRPVIPVEQVRVGPLPIRSPDDDSTNVAVHLMNSRVAVIVMRAGFGRVEGVTEGRAKVNRTLRQERNAVHVRSLSLVESMPMNRSRRSCHMISHIDHNNVVLTDVDRRAWHFPIDGHDASLDSVGGDTLVVVAVVDVTQICAARLACTFD